MDLAFVAYPGLLATMGGANFWALIFFLMLVTLGVDSVFGNFDFYQTFISDLFPIILKKNEKRSLLYLPYMLLLYLQFDLH